MKRLQRVPNSVEGNRRPAAPLEVLSQFASPLSTQRDFPAAVAHLDRTPGVLPVPAVGGGR
ncbi:MAG TPA: hypothetical protein PKM43_23680 [Verrucomicrobiota bacterium]|nr:hypothetical protein [Verrucomicrobiota bacterium]HRZ54557.1 hypothetical protein [Candidatus Paceibacterota bacterium]